MTQRLLQVLGVVLILAGIGGALAGFAVLKDRVRVIIAADEVATGPDPAALLRDDVQELARKLDELQSALAGNFEKLDGAIEGRAEARHGEVTALRQELDGLRRRVEAVSDATKSLTELVESLAAQSLAAHPLTMDRAAMASEADPGRGDAASQPIPLTPEAAASTAVERETPVAAPTPAESTPAASKPAGFLSFSIPASQFRFDEVQDYVLVPELCRVGFDAKSTLHDFSGVTSQVRGGFRADFDDPSGSCSGEIFVKAETLKTGVDGRDAGMREHLDTKNHAEIGFVIERFVPAAGGVDVVKQTARGDVVGKMTIRGQTRPLQMAVSIEVDPQKRVVVKGESPLKLSDFGVPVPSQLGVINMQDEVKIWVALRARMQKGRVK